MLNPQGFRDNLDTLTKWVTIASTTANRGSNPLKVGVTELNVDYTNPTTDSFTGFGANSFVGGQFWAEAMRYCLRDSVSFTNYWSVMEGNNVASSIGYLDHSTGAKKPSYYHFQEMTKYLQGSYLRDTSNATYLKAIASKTGEYIAVLVINEDSVTQFKYTNYLGWSATTAGTFLKIDAGLSRTYTDTIDALSSTLLLFDQYGNISEKYYYKQSDGSSQPGFHQRTNECSSTGTFATQGAVDGYYPALYKNLVIGGTSTITIDATKDNTNFHASNSITINGPFSSGTGSFSLTVDPTCQ